MKEAFLSRSWINEKL